MGKLRKEEVNGGEYLAASLAEGECVDEDSLAAVSGEQTPDGKGGIEGILPISYGQLMGERVLRYDINACVPFGEYKKQIRKKEALCRVFLSILDTYALADSYLLDPSCFLLEQEYIYVDRSTGKAWLVLYPVVPAEGQEQGGGQDFAALFREMLRGIRLADEDMAFYGMLSYELDSMEVFNRAAFRELLLKEGSRAASGGAGAGPAGERYSAAGAGAGGSGKYGAAGAGAGGSGKYGAAGAGAGGYGAPGAGSGGGYGASGAGSGGGYGAPGAGLGGGYGAPGAGSGGGYGAAEAGSAAGRSGERGRGAGAGSAAGGYGDPGRGTAAGRYKDPGAEGTPWDGEPPRLEASEGEGRGFLGGLFGRRKEKAGQEKEPGRRGLAGKAEEKRAGKAEDKKAGKTEDKKAGKAEDKKAGKAEDKKAGKAEERKSKKEGKGKEKVSGLRLPDEEEIPEGFLALDEPGDLMPRAGGGTADPGSWKEAAVSQIPLTVDDEVEIPPTDDEFPEDSGPSLYLKQTDTGQVTEAAWFPFEIGREGSGLILDPDKVKVSRQHAEIIRTEEGFFLRDVSKLGTFIDGVKIPKGVDVPLKNGMKVVFKEVEFLVIIENG